MKIVLIGAVSSSFQTLKKLVQYKFDIGCVFGYEPLNTINVSGLVNMRDFCNQEGIQYKSFTKINEYQNVNIINSISPDLIFAVGFSQLISEEILAIPTLGCIGFHPTALPSGRGRAPLAWLILNEKQGAATFFLMSKGIDDGPIFIQQYFDVLESDNIESLKDKLSKSIDIALDNWLPNLLKGQWNPIPQDEKLASYYGKRNPMDGWIDWSDSAVDINKLVNATSRTYPGAFTFWKDKKIVIWKSSVEFNLKIKGVKGRILLIDDNRFLIQTGEGCLWIEEYEIENSENNNIPALKVGEKLGYNVEFEIYKLKKSFIQ